MENIPISTADLIAKNSAALPKFAKDFCKYSFWQYTRLELADLILSGSSFRVSNLKNMNDLDEADLHDENREHVFALCFCNSDTEKIPMWYLYSGLAGKGAALGITPGKMLKLIASIQTVYGTKLDQKKEEGVPLNVGTDVELRFGWVYYRKTKQPQNIMYRNKWYQVDDAHVFEKENYFIKSYPWEYEREFRLVFFNRTAAVYDALYVEIPPEVQKYIKVKLAPEIKEEQFSKIAEMHCIGPDLSHKPDYSELAIRMNLFSRNRVGLMNYIREELQRPKPEINGKELCALLQKTKLCGK